MREKDRIALQNGIGVMDLAISNPVGLMSVGFEVAMKAIVAYRKVI